MFNDDPPEGMEYVLIKTKLTYTGGEGLVEASDSDFSSVSNGQVFDWSIGSVCCMEDVNHPEIDAKLISPGAEAEGWITQIVFIDDPYPMLAIGSFRDDLDDGLFWLISP